MKVFGITGGVGAGKSEVLTYLGQNYDATVIQADEAGYLVMLPGGECYGEIVKLFGRQITTETGELDRKRIAEIVFQDEEKLKALNAIVHPAVAKAQRKFLMRHRARDVVILDIPLLFEKGGWRKVGAIAVVSAPAWMQTKRVMRRPGMTRAKLKAIRRLQVPDRVKRARADFVIETGRPKSETHRQIRAIASCFRAR